MHKVSLEGWRRILPPCSWWGRKADWAVKNRWRFLTLTWDEFLLLTLWLPGPSVFPNQTPEDDFPVYEAELLVCVPKFTAFVCFSANTVSQQVPEVKPQACEWKHRQFFGDALSPSSVPVGKVEGILLLFFLALVTISSQGCGPLSRACSFPCACARGLGLLNPKVYGCILNENYIWNQFYQFPGRWQGENMWKMSFHLCWDFFLCPLSPIASSFLIIWPWENVFTQ